MKKAFDYYNKAIEAPISTVSYYAFYNLAKYYYLTGNTVLIKDEDKAIKYLDIASSHAIEAAILLLYLYTEKYLNKKMMIFMIKLNYLFLELKIILNIMKVLNQ